MAAPVTHCPVQRFVFAPDPAADSPLPVLTGTRLATLLDASARAQLAAWRGRVAPPATVALRVPAAALPLGAASVWLSLAYLFRDAAAVTAPLGDLFCVVPESRGGGALLAATWSSYMLLLALQLELDASMRACRLPPPAPARPPAACTRRAHWAPQYPRLVRHWFTRSHDARCDRVRRWTVLTVLNRWFFDRSRTVGGATRPLLAPDDPLTTLYDVLFELIHKAWPTYGALQAAVADAFAHSAPVEASASSPHTTSTPQQASPVRDSGGISSSNSGVSDIEDKNTSINDGNTDGFDDGDDCCSREGEESSGFEPSSECTTASWASDSISIRRPPLPHVEDDAASGHQSILDTLRMLLYVRQPHEIRVATLVWLHETFVVNVAQDARCQHIAAALPSAMDAVQRLYQRLDLHRWRRDPRYEQFAWLRISDKPVLGPAAQLRAVSDRWRAAPNTASWAEFRTDAFENASSGADTKLLTALLLAPLATDVTAEEARRILTGIRLYDKDRHHHRRQRARRAAGGARVLRAARYVRHERVGLRADWNFWHNGGRRRTAPLVRPAPDAIDVDAYARRSVSDRPDVLRSGIQLLSLLESVFQIKHRPKDMSRANVRLSQREIGLLAPAAVWTTFGCAVHSGHAASDLDTLAVVQSATLEAAGLDTADVQRRWAQAAFGRPQAEAAAARTAPVGDSDLAMPPPRLRSTVVATTLVSPHGQKRTRSPPGSPKQSLPPAKRARPLDITATPSFTLPQ
jgi:hypothetical protein